MSNDATTAMTGTMDADGPPPRVDHGSDLLLKLAKPFWFTLATGSVGILVFVAFLTIIMDRSAIRASEQTLRSVLSDRLASLANVALEYGYWDDAVENIVANRNAEWIEENLVDYLQSAYGVTGVHVVDGEGRAIINVADGALTTEAALSAYGASVTRLVKDARILSPTGVEPTPVSGFVGDAAHAVLATAVTLTTWDDEKYVNTDHVLILTRRIDQDYLNDIRRTYQLWELRFSQDGAGFAEAELPASDFDGRLLGRFVWSPVLVGAQLLPFLGVGVLCVYIAMLFAARSYLKRAAAVIQELEQAKAQAEAAREAMKRQAVEDALTGLGNRRAFDATLGRIKASRRGGAGSALMLVDLDGFKAINDSFGHEAGDEALQHFAALFERVLGDEAATFRLGGDEFAAIFRHADERDVERLGERIVAALDEPQMVQGRPLRFGASVGVSFAPNAERWLSEADEALYIAKRSGRGRLVVAGRAAPPEAAARAAGAARVGEGAVLNARRDSGRVAAAGGAG